MFLKLFYSNKSIFYTVGTWISNIGLLTINWEFQFDLLSVSMLVTVSLISLLVHIYSWSYMENDPFIIRFICLLSIFTFFMFVLVTSSNFVQLFFGWEGIGACSYFLIGFWYTRVQANKSALKAIIINKIGDICLLIAISLIAFVFQSLDFSVVFPLISIFSTKTFFFFNLEINIIEFICFWLLLAAVGKSAQIGLHIWLPDAMEGPTPVSALIHAATMVTAGIFLIIKCSFIFEYAPLNLILILFIGSVTAIFAASAGLLQNDIKKIIAYSTCSQLGYMFYSCGLSNYIGSLFHLINHAFFKALLFLSAGSIIHAVSNEQDIRKMGSLQYYLPVSYISFLIGSFSLMGLPFLSGFYSKDFILETSFFYNFNFSTFTYIVTTLTATLTILYSVRLLYLVFIIKNNSFKIIYTSVKESSWFLLIPLIILSFFSIFSGYFMKDFFIGSGANTFSNTIYYLPKNFNLLDIENLDNLKILPVFFSFTFIIIFTFLYFYVFKIQKYSLIFYKSYLLHFLLHKWYFDYTYNLFAKYFFTYFYKMWITLDKGLLEILQPIAITSSISYINKVLVNKVSSTIPFYFYIFIFSFIIILLFTVIL